MMKSKIRKLCLIGCASLLATVLPGMSFMKVSRFEEQSESFFSAQWDRLSWAGRSVMTYAKCKAVDGRFQSTMMGEFKCRTRSDDAHKLCLDSSQCNYGCSAIPLSAKSSDAFDHGKIGAAECDFYE
jgi:hypothetical protein